jgi:hypothetical protein
MAATRIIEEERGTFTGTVHAHQGYYAGDFSGLSPRPLGSSWSSYGAQLSSERMLDRPVVHGAPRGERWNS